jgi:hypothetical protein
MKHGVVLLSGSLLASGCYYGAMQGARTLGEGHVVAGGNLQMPAFFSSEDRREAEDSGEDYLETYGSLFFSTGATDDIDLGFTAAGYGVGPHVKYGFLPHDEPTAVSVLLNVTYVLPAQVVSPRAGLSVGRLLSPNLELYGGFEAGYGPDLANIPDDPESGEHDWDYIDNTFFDCVKAGCVYTIRPEGSDREYSSLVPESVLFEFAFPIDLQRSMIIAGLGVVY